MDALPNIQTPVPAARFGPHAPLRAPGTKSGRPDGLAAHRSPLDGLITHFPVTRRVAGDEAFDAMASRFIAIERSRQATRFPNWEAFPSFLRSQGRAASIEYVADIAELEMARGKAKYAAYARPIGAHAEYALVARPFREVEVRRLPPGGHAFISALLQGRTIAAALDAATAADPKFDIAINRALLIEANGVIGIREQANAKQLNA